MTINVTSEDIARGKRKDCFACPLALAGARAIGFKVGTAGGNYWNEERANVSIPLPFDHPARYFVARFDDELEVQPFSFEIDLLDQYRSKP